MTALVTWFLGFLEGCVTEIPLFSIDSQSLHNMKSAVETILDYIAKANYLVPVPTILLILSLIYGFKLVKFSMFLINWVIRRIADVIP